MPPSCFYNEGRNKFGSSSMLLRLRGQWEEEGNVLEVAQLLSYKLLLPGSCCADWELVGGVIGGCKE